jgi:hypothetical protein
LNEPVETLLGGDLNTPAYEIGEVLSHGDRARSSNLLIPVKVNK